MKFVRHNLDNMERCYSVNTLKMQGETALAFASESIGGPCYLYRGNDFSMRETIWESAGGTMSIIPLGADDFYAVQSFFPGFQSEGAKIVYGKRNASGEYDIQDVLHQSFLHRFDVFQTDSGRYFCGCTVCSSKKDREDWSDPGKVYVGQIQENPAEPFALTVLIDGLVKNHGYWRGAFEGKDAGYIGCDQGVYAILPPEAGEGWRTVKLMEQPTSEVVPIDIDGCGNDEFCTFEPFHGNRMQIYKKTEDGFSKVYSYPYEIDFAHAMWAGQIYGIPSVICGVRRMNCELFCVQHINGQYVTTVIDQGGGPANLTVFSREDGSMVLASANHTENKAVYYEIEP